MHLISSAPTGPIETRWERHRFEMKLVNPANRRKYTVIVVGTGLAGASLAASLGEAGYKVKAFCYQDSARRACDHRELLPRHSYLSARQQRGMHRTTGQFQRDHRRNQRKGREVMQKGEERSHVSRTSAGPGRARR